MCQISSQARPLTIIIIVRGTGDHIILITDRGGRRLIFIFFFLHAGYVTK